ncbi:HD domain-containing protein [Patescibacteria group bacterium]|nr:HD domain-containing protein [Patescibacteria group bacterium]MBU1673024.1 HD domain-containing protein [Patescibacteria group bacterium]MBU1963293.1 HD domain-containing protein [Patescibacteria group bacterium]
MIIKLPQHIEFILNQLKAGGFEAYIVGGCVRDILLDKEPKDWDITTSALPQDIEKAFTSTYYNNKFGTVVALIEGEEVEITTYRSEVNYSDKRHPDEVKFGVSLEEDLKRRDFTINAMAYDGQNMIDLFKGKADLKKRTIRAVGDANERYQEDALRMMRAIRFAAQLDFQIESKTWQAIIKNKELIKAVSGERIRDELMKIISSDDPFYGMWLMKESGLQAILLPELEKNVGLAQNKHHPYTAYYHALLSMAFTPSDDPLVKLAALFHDIGKPQTKEGEGEDASFHNHEIVSSKLTRRIMRRLKFPKKNIDRVSHLIRHHMFYYNIGEITDAGVRRILVRVGKHNLQDLIDLRIGDRLGSACAKAKPFKLVELEKRLIEVQKDPIDTNMLAIDGHDIMKLTDLPPGREIGLVLNQLLDEVLDDPKLNTREYLIKRAKEIDIKKIDIKGVKKSVAAKAKKLDSDELKKQFPDGGHMMSASKDS